MPTKTIAWTTGTGNITLTYTGQGDGTILVSSDDNTGVARSQTITIQTTAGTPVVTQNITINQAAYVPPFVSQDFSYTGSVQSCTLPAGTYKLQVWGAQGGSSTGSYAATGSKGGYSEGILTLASTTILYVFVGGAGETINSSSTSAAVVNGGWNGGGGAKPYNYVGTGPSMAYSYPRAGGGATDIALVTSSMTYSNNRTNRSSDSLLSRIIVAGGGGGSSYIRKGGGSSYSYTSTGVSVGGGTSGGGQYGGSQSSAGTGGGFGYGGNQSTGFPIMPGAGGGGWYGGGSSNPSQATAQTVNYNGGGSGFVNTAENAQYRPTGYTGLELDFGTTISGNQDFEAVNGGTETGHEGNGYARITCIDGNILIPLTFEILGDGTIGWKASDSSLTKTIQYSKNGGSWTSITSTTEGVTISVVNGDTVRFRGDNTSYGTSQYYNCFTATCDFNVKGNIMSLIDSTDFESLKTLSDTYTFDGLFRSNTHVKSAKNLALPATTLTTGCYRYLFWHCTGLTHAPSTLPALTLVNRCYLTMFADCPSLIAVPKIQATTVAEYCCYSMFLGCTSLTTAPELPATTLYEYCYYQMFQNCTSLTAAPELPATTLVSNCYYGMFHGCTNLNYVKCLATSGINRSLSTQQWLYQVKSSGTFVKNPNTPTSSGTTGQYWPRSSSGIPSGWTVEDA